VHPLAFDYVKTFNNININSGNKLNSVVYSVWDCAGQEKFGGLRDGYYIGASAAIIMADSTSRTSIKNIQFWLNSLSKVININTIPICVVFTKCDLEQDCKSEEIDNFIKTIN